MPDSNSSSDSNNLLELPKVIYDGRFFWERIFNTKKYAPYYDSCCMKPVINSDGIFPIKNYDSLSRFDITKAARKAKTIL